MKPSEIQISQNFGQDLEGAKKFGEDMSEFLEPLQNAGMISFEKKTRRICDFCGKELKENDKFITIGEDDKCEECQNKEKK